MAGLLLGQRGVGVPLWLRLVGGFFCFLGSPFRGVLLEPARLLPDLSVHLSAAGWRCVHWDQRAAIELCPAGNDLGGGQLRHPFGINADDDVVVVVHHRKRRDIDGENRRQLLDPLLNPIAPVLVALGAVIIDSTVDPTACSCYTLVVPLPV